MKLYYFLLFILLSACVASNKQSLKKENKLSVIAYYAGNKNGIDGYPVEKLTHIIYSFLHLKGNKLAVDNAGDSLTITHLVSLKARNPQLKVILSLGGWGGCETCSDVFATEVGRKEFAQSVKELNDYFKTDGIDLDWEYPAIAGFPGHTYTPQDKNNFTLLVKDLRYALGKKNEISFAAGGFTTFLQESIDWKAVVPLVDKINLMTYDLVNGNSKFTGHHTPLYSTPLQLESTDHAVRYLDSIGVPKNKMVIGAAFYARVFDVLPPSQKGLYGTGTFNRAIGYQKLNFDSLQSSSFNYYWDSTAAAPYFFSETKNQLITFDDERSITLKTQYATNNGLNGIMFWELGNDKKANGLLDAIYKAL